MFIIILGISSLDPFLLHFIALSSVPPKILVYFQVQRNISEQTSSLIVLPFFKEIPCLDIGSFTSFHQLLDLIFFYIRDEASLTMYFYVQIIFCASRLPAFPISLHAL